MFARNRRLFEVRFAEREKDGLKRANIAALFVVDCVRNAGPLTAQFENQGAYTVIAYTSDNSAQIQPATATRHRNCIDGELQTKTKPKIKGNAMKHLLIGTGTLLMLTMVSADVVAQNGRGDGNRKSRGSNAPEFQTRVGAQLQATRSQAGRRGAAGQHGNQSGQMSGVASMNTGGFDLLRMWEEEKLARDVYTSLAKSSKVPIFQNISRAESQHMQALERLIRSGDTGAGILNNTPGVFVFPEYQRLYQTLLADGKRSSLDALMVGAKIEEMDIADLRGMLTQTRDPQTRQILERLMQGSQNHLRAFASQIAMQGASYNAEFLPQAEFDQIATSPGQSRGQQAGRSGTSAGQGSQNRGNGPKFGFQRQSGGSQGPGPRRQGSSRQSGGSKGFVR